jgi:hypothetical protein
MFKFLQKLSYVCTRIDGSPLPGGWFGTALLLTATATLGCHTLAAFPPVDLNQPGWNTREAQVIWRRNARSPEIVGELLLASGPAEQVYVQFTKNPFPLMVAQSTRRGWELLIPPENHRFSGTGRPPQRVILLQLPRMLSGEKPPRGWSWEVLQDGGWRLQNHHSGEFLEGHWLR